MFKIIVLSGLVLLTAPDKKVDVGPILPQCDMDYIAFLLDAGIKPSEIKLICKEG